MDSESGLSQNHVNQMNSGSSSVNSISSKQQDDHPRPNYTIPGILHFIQHEWARFEMERAQWEVERAELQVGLAHPHIIRPPIWRRAEAHVVWRIQ